MEVTDMKKVSQYKDIYKQLRNKFRWHVPDQRILMMAASFYVIKNTPFDLKAFTELADFIKKESSLFSTMRSHQRFTTAAMLLQRFEHPQEKYAEMTDLYDKLVKGGFARGAFTYISALVMLSGDPDDSAHESSIKRSLAVHKGMKTHHPFITSKNDYPLSVLLAQLDKEVEPLMDHVEYFYRDLNQNNFRKGNDLQFLSHILSIDNTFSPQQLVSQCQNMRDKLIQAKIKIKPMHYPEIGLLALVNADENDLHHIKELTEVLNTTKWFKWHKDLNTIMAANFAVREKIDQNDIVETGIFTTIETIIQAQQAAMIAAFAGGSAAATSGSNN
ncbi:DUF4003 family protein [Salipaludibacillus aurantiacus]|uniref:DUF4003 domain-containing protein n=1 Tax=Salipaludibacillus aurantiacus TaxID=1601833 RepID=A0A1H9TVE2_9BACI|nr:DUF4003 family protein [Salipaludibacillus aurantiacus]SES01002.1 Protein of unknown function [Salipaludibacillus aurantiacus]